MKYLILFFLLFTFTGCNGIKKLFKKDVEIKEENTVIVAKRNGLSDLVNFEDIISKEIEIVRYEPVYYTKDGKDTVEIKQVIYRKVDTSKKVEETIKIDTTTNITKAEDNFVYKDKSEESKVVEKSKSFNYFLYGIIVGLLIMLSIPVIKFIKKLPIKLF